MRNFEFKDRMTPFNKNLEQRFKDGEFKPPKPPSTFCIIDPYKKLPKPDIPMGWSRSLEDRIKRDKGGTT